MKKQLLTIAILGAMAVQGFSQSKIILPAASYDRMKAEGKLNPKVQYVLIDDGHSFLPPAKAEERTPITNDAPRGGIACSCLIPSVETDATFSVADFIGSAPPLYRSDDNSTPLKNTVFDFCLYGTNYTGFYINNNGNISFGAPQGTYTPNGFPDNTFVMIAPFWADVDTRNAGSGVVYYKITPSYAIIQWKNVGYYNQHSDKKNTFQVIITDGADPILPAGNNIAFCYGDMQWTTGDYTGGVGGFGPSPPATVGLNAGDGVNYIQLGRFDHPGIGYDGSYGLNDGVSWLDNQSFYLNGCSSTNIAPIVSGINNCDTVKICGLGDSILIHPLFLSPEAGQTTTITINLNSTPGATIISNTPGNTASAVVQIVASALNAGTNYITFTATDNGSPIGTTIVNAIVYVDTSAFGPSPAISGILGFCNGDSTLLSVTPTSFDTYIWNTGSDQTSIEAHNSGTYFCTTTLNGCTKTASVNVVQYPAPTPVIAGYPFTCSGGTTNLYVDSTIYSTYQWSSGQTTSSVNVPNGIYSLTVTDAFGCTGTSPNVTVAAPVNPVITGQTAVCNGAIAALTTTYSYVSYNWNPGAITNDTAFVPNGVYTVQVVDVNGCSLTSSPFTVSNFAYNLNVTGNAPFCAGQGINLTASSTSVPSAVPSFAWAGGPATATDSISAGGSYTVTVTYPNGCTRDTTFAVAAPNPLPTPTIVGSLVMCGTGGTTTLTVSSTYSSYSWSNSATTISTSVGSGGYDVTVTDANSCVGTSPSVSVTNFNPSLSISGNQTICAGDNIVLTANPSITAGASYLWSNSGTASTTSVSTAGVVSVTVSYANGCSVSDSVTTVVNPMPSATVTTNDTVMTATVAGAVYQWLDCSTGYSPIAGATNSTYGSAGGAGSYAAMVTLNGCVDTTNCVTFTGINEYGADNYFIISPNPFTNEFQVSSSKFMIKEVKVFDVLGQVIFYSSFNNHKSTIDMSLFAKGVYFVQVMNEKGMRTNRKIMKE